MAASDDPEQALRAAVAKRQRAERAVIAARAEERAAIAAALDAKLRPTDVVKISGYTRETIRRLGEAGRNARSQEAEG